MIYHRTPTGAHRTSVRVLAVVVAVAMAVLGFLGTPPEVRSEVKWQDPIALKPIPGSTATGEYAPVLRNVEVDGSSGLSTTRAPILIWRNVPTGLGQVAFKVTTLAERNPQTVWSKTVAVDADGTARAQVAVGPLQQGSTYLWTAYDPSDPSRNAGPFGMTVDTQRSSTQEMWPVGSLQIGQTTGEMVYNWAGPSLATLGGSIGWSLLYRPSNRASASLPRGWNLTVAGSSPWKSLGLGTDGALTLADTGGTTMTFTRTSTNLWAIAGGSRQAWRQGAPSQVQESADGSITVTDPTGMVTAFPKPVAGALVRPSAVWQDNKPTAQQTWTDGRLRELTDPVSGNKVVFSYAPEASCATTLDPGFVMPPTGSLCGVADWAGNVVMLQYVDTPQGPELGRIVAGLGQGVLAQVTDFGYDAAGRLASLREPLAASAIASGVLSGVGESDPRTLTQVAYDGAGRVASVKLPAHLGAGTATGEEQTVRPTQQFAYAPFTVTSPGVTTPSGALARVWTSPETMLKLRSQDESGRSYEFAYDAQGNLTEQKDVRAGLITQTRYDALGRPIEQIGPTTNPTSPTATRVTTAYDSDRAGNPWTGLLVRYWNTAGFVGVPAEAKVGPEIPGSNTTTPTLTFNWTGNPLGGSGPWSARLTGRFKAPKDGIYRFANATSAPMWINGRACKPDCDVRLAAEASAYLQLDVSSPTGAAAGINATLAEFDVDGKAVSAAAPIKTSELRPNLNWPTSSTTYEFKKGSGVTPLVSRFAYDTDTGNVLKTIAPSGAVQSRTYAPYDPAHGQWGQALTLTDATGATTTTDYGLPGEIAEGCDGTTAEQTGAVQSLVKAGGTIEQVVAPDGSIIKSSGPGVTTCAAGYASGLIDTSTTSGVGESSTVARAYMVGGNPLHTSQSTAAGSRGTTEDAFYDITGAAWKTIDAYGTVTTRDFNPVTGDVTSITDVTAKGEKRTTTYTYTPSGDVKTIAFDGTTVATYVYDASGRISTVTYANGTKLTRTYDSAGRPSAQTYAFPNGTTAKDSLVYSPTGRILSHTIDGPGGTSTFEYTYNVDGRLIDTIKTGTSETSATRWQSTYEGTGGAGGNRTSQTITGPNGSTTSTFAYGENDRPTSTTKNGIAGDLPADAAGRITAIGGVQITRNALGQITSATQGTQTISVEGDAGGALSRRFVDTDPANPVDVTARFSGTGLVLDASGRIAGRLGQTDGATMVLNAAGDPVRWTYGDLHGDTLWRTDGGGIPTATRLFSPNGTAIAAAARTPIRTTLDLAAAGRGYQSGAGGVTLPLATPIVVLGARSYSPGLGRFLEPDATASTNAYEYAGGDPVNLSDPSGHASVGMIVGIVASVVVGLALGAVTGGAGAATGWALAGAVIASAAVGAVAGAVGNVVQASIDGTPIDVKELLISAGIDAAIGAVTFGIGRAASKWIAAKRAATREADAALAGDIARRVDLELAVTDSEYAFMTKFWNKSEANRTLVMAKYWDPNEGGQLLRLNGGATRVTAAEAAAVQPGVVQSAAAQRSASFVSIESDGARSSFRSVHSYQGNPVPLAGSPKQTLAPIKYLEADVYGNSIKQGSLAESAVLQQADPYYVSPLERAQSFLEAP